VCVCVCVCVYVCVCACVYICMYVCMYVCVFVCMYVCMYVCACLCKRTLQELRIFSPPTFFGISLFRRTQVEQLQRVTEDKTRIEQAFDQTRTHAGSVDTENRISVIKQQRLQEDLVRPCSTSTSWLTR
jgi:hypothetical protein